MRQLFTFLLLKALARTFIGVGRCRTVLATVRGSSLHVLGIGVPADAHVMGLWRGRRGISHVCSVQLGQRDLSGAATRPAGHKRQPSSLEVGTANGNRTRILALKGLRANRCTIAALRKETLSIIRETQRICHAPEIARRHSFASVFASFY